ncbi:MAG: hypothetical protein QOE36_288 [Gaiellaceae bacterium]|jgi:hypothetical protein|nr:hypothetical protein [Gaiellaceae bacterium]MEA2390205.1 hypothetical protein [Solirubrobacteraceae bacterium]
MQLAGGSLIFLAFTVFFTLVVMYSTYSRRGSAISQRPYGDQYSGAPGANGPSSLTHDARATWNVRGTR